MVLKFLAGEWEALSKLWRLEEGDGIRQDHIQSQVRLLSWLGVQEMAWS